MGYVICVLFFSGMKLNGFQIRIYENTGKYSNL